tara:strand:+ start:11351 stop:12007 length:657 start_codon:yes stop_codon:yes gene_type:complete
MIDNYKEIIQEPFDLENIRERVEGGEGICEFDLYILEQYIKSNNIENIVELGCGTSTKFLKTIEGIKVKTFALDAASSPGKEREHHEYIKMNITMETIGIILEESEFCDLFIIDCDHTRNFAKLYYEELLLKIKKPAFIHDFFTKEQVWAEEAFLKEVLASESSPHSTFITTNSADREVGEICGISNIEKFLNPPYRSSRPPLCSIIIEPNEHFSPGT